jgi:adenylate cyclase
MGTEIERKFLVRDDRWRDAADEGTPFRQGYLVAQRERTVRVRLEGAKGVLTIKGPGLGAARAEFEYAIPREDASEMLETLCLRPLIEKTRYRVEHEGLLWEVDVFAGANEGLVLAEVELEREDQQVVLPAWVDREVTGDRRYFNAYLVACPFRNWRDHC